MDKQLPKSQNVTVALNGIEAKVEQARIPESQREWRTHIEISNELHRDIAASLEKTAKSLGERCLVSS